MGHRFRIHGLVVDSPVPLAGTAGLDAHRDEVVDVGFELVAGLVETPSGAVLSHVDDAASGRRYTLVEDPRGWALHFAGTATVRIDRSSPQVVVTAPDTTPHSLLSVLLGGPTLVALALLRGHGMLHASAVSSPEGVVAFVGPAGCGKSTLARLTSGETTPLFSDDALRVDVAGADVTAHRGTTTSRLRARGDELATSPGSVLTHTADGRQSLVTDDLAPAAGALALLVLPRLSAHVDDLRLVPVPRRSALLQLAGAGALDGVVDPRLLDLQFDLAARLVERVPVVEAYVPWRQDTLDPRLGDDLARLLRDTLSVSDGADHG